MKALAELMVLSLAMPLLAQVVTPPAALPRPGIPVGVSGGIGTPATGLTPSAAIAPPAVPVNPNLPPAGIYMPQDMLLPQYPDPVIIVPTSPSSPSRAPTVWRARPNGLGVTLLGGEPPPIAPTAPAPTPVVSNGVTNGVTPVVRNGPATNGTPVVTNPPPANGSVPNTGQEVPPLQY